MAPFKTLLKVQPRNRKYTGMETWQIFSCILTMAKIFEELLTTTLNKIAISVWYVSAKPVVLHAGLDDQLRRMQMTEKIRNIKK